MMHCIKPVHIWTFSDPALPRKSSYSVQMLQNVDQKNSKYRHFLRSGGVIVFIVDTLKMVQDIGKLGFKLCSSHVGI